MNKMQIALEKEIAHVQTMGLPKGETLRECPDCGEFVLERYFIYNPKNDRYVCAHCAK